MQKFHWLIRLNSTLPYSTYNFTLKYRFFRWKMMHKIRTRQSVGRIEDRPPMTNFHTLLACNMSFCRFFGSRNTILKLLTLISVHGWSYMAKLHNFDIKWCNFVKNWFILVYYWPITCLYRGVWVKRHTFETLVVNFCT